MAAGQASNNQELIEFLVEVEQTILEIQQSFDTTTEDVGGILLQAEMLLRDVVLFEGLIHSPGGEVIVQAIADVVRTVQNHVDEGYHQHATGWPQIPISEEQLVTLLDLHFFNVDIANGLQEEASFTEVSDTDLDTITRQSVDTHPNSGEKSLAGYLRGIGLRIKRSSVRESLFRVDPRGVQA